MPRNFVKWLAQNVDENCIDISATGKVIPVTPLSIHNVVGTPLGGRDISETGESDKDDFLNLFGVSKIPTIKTFRSKILSKEEMSDD